MEISSGFASSVITRPAAKGLTTWAEVEVLAESVIEARLSGPKVKLVAPGRFLTPRTFTQNEGDRA